jgi:alcohol dehydrogenase/L-iditol 2-dehydrogenase
LRAALLLEPGRLKVDDFADPEPGPGEVRIAVGGVGLCGSDLSVFSGKWKAPAYPWIMGHEAFGVVEAVGSDVSSARVGETVVVEPNAACLSCEQCERGWSSACVGRESVGMNRPGAQAEYLVVPGQFAWSISAFSPQVLVCVEPTTVVMSALRRLKSPFPESALVVGVGAQGLMMSLALIERGVSAYVHDVNLDRVAFAAELGAFPVAAEGDRFSLVVDTVGSPGAMAVSLDRAQVGGTVLCLGLDSRPFDLTAQRLVRQQLTIQGSLTYDHPDDFEASIAMITEGRFSPERVVTDEYALDEAHLAFERASFSRGKTWIRVAHPTD